MQWFDVDGLRRCLMCHSPGLCLQIERGSEQGLCDTQLLELDKDVTLPVYDGIHQMIRFPTYCVSACTIHTGRSMQQGHYRTGLRTDRCWFLYEDNVLPQQMQDWQTPHGYRITTVWLTLHSSSSDRMNT